MNTPVTTATQPIPNDTIPSLPSQPQPDVIPPVNTQEPTEPQIADPESPIFLPTPEPGAASGALVLAVTDTPTIAPEHPSSAVAEMGPTAVVPTTSVLSLGVLGIVDTLSPLEETDYQTCQVIIAMGVQQLRQCRTGLWPNPGPAPLPGRIPQR